MNSKSKSNESKKEEFDKSNSLNSSIFKNSNEPVEDLTKLKNDLKIENDKTSKFKSTFNEMEKEDIQISGIYKNESNVIKELNENVDYSLNIEDNIFKNRARKILSDVYNLKENLLYPHFEVQYSSKNKSNIVKIYYYQISVGFDEKIGTVWDSRVGGKIFADGGVGERDDADGERVGCFEKPESNKQKETITKKEDYITKEIKNDKMEDKNERESFVFLDDRKIYMICFKEMPMIFQKNKEGFKNVSVISKDFQSFCEFEIKKINEKVFETSFNLALINKELTEIKGKMDTTKYNMKNSEEEKKNSEEKYKEYQNLYNSLLEKYSKEKIIEHLNNKNNELELLKSTERNDENKNNNSINESEQKINELTKEIEEYEILSKIINIKINKLQQEFDGLFFSTKEIILSNNIGDKLIIPAQTPIIVEVNNHCKYNKIIENIRIKKNLLKSLKIDKNNFYYIGILRGIDVDLQEKLKVNNAKKHFDFNKVIVIYPEGTNFLGESLYEQKNEIKEESNIVLIELGKLMNEIIKIREDISKLNNKFQEMENKHTPLFK